jgi:hypothetical protein
MTDGELYRDSLRGIETVVLRGSVSLPGEKVELLMHAPGECDGLTVQELHFVCWLQRGAQGNNCCN